MTTLLVIIFVVGYLCIATESLLKIDKAAIALLMCVLCWVCYMAGSIDYTQIMHADDVAPYLTGNSLSEITTQVHNFVNEHLIMDHMGDTCEILFFLIGAMTIVEIVDGNGGFNFVQRALGTTSKKVLLWRITFMTFFLSAILDNLTTSIVMIMVLRKLVTDHKERMVFASLVIIAANSGGAFSPIGDITTIMLWIKGNITTVGVIKEIFLPSLISALIPALILQFQLKGKLQMPPLTTESARAQISYTQKERNLVFVVGVGGLIFVPFFRHITGLPPFMGILLVLSLLWCLTEIAYHRRGVSASMKLRVAKLLPKIDMSTILFFLGILMAVATLQETGVLLAFGKWLNDISGGNHYLVTGIIGIASSIVDNVPLVAGCMGMYAVDPSVPDFAPDGLFWQLLAYCAGVGGSMLIVGSAAGVVVMGLEKITFGWYMKRIMPVAFAGYLAGILIYWAEKTIGW